MQCKATIQRGERCENSAVDDAIYCHVHASLAGGDRPDGTSQSEPLNTSSNTESDSAPRKDATLAGDERPAIGSQTIEDVVSRLDGLEDAIAELTKCPKDNWDKFQIISALMIPAAITFIGIVFSFSMKQAEIQSSQTIAEGNLAVAKTNAKVAQAQLIHSFVDELTQKDPGKRLLAVSAVKLALGEDGAKLLESVGKTDPDPAVRSEASEWITDLWRPLIPKLFSDVPAIRSDTTMELLELGSSETGIVELVAATINHKDVTPGVLSALYIIKEYGPYPPNAILAAEVLPILHSHLDVNIPEIKTALSRITRMQDEVWIGSEHATVSADAQYTVKWPISDSPFPKHEVSIFYDATAAVTFVLESPTGGKSNALAVNRNGMVMVSDNFVMSWTHRVSPFAADTIEFT